MDRFEPKSVTFIPESSVSLSVSENTVKKPQQLTHITLQSILCRADECVKFNLCFIELTVADLYDTKTYDCMTYAESVVSNHGTFVQKKCIPHKNFLT